ncbi:MAG TPA: IS200/IS605 family transposase [Saprospiraceae bacterium]|nr:IS200/IS605 family transposase [Saprospiraceae bacterium]HNT20756.1 IS200/IS605 family transposase [Saprospiraceae bacterium]
MSTNTQIFYHIVFSTKYRERTLHADGRPALFRYITAILKNKKCHMYRINGVEDHLHMLMDLHPSTSLSDLIKDIKLASSKFIKENKLFPSFGGWQDGYGAFTCSYREKDALIAYVNNQERHHQKKSSMEEFIEFLNDAGVEYDEKYLG